MDPFDLGQVDLVAAAVVVLRHPADFVRGDCLGMLDGPALLEVGLNSCRSKRTGPPPPARTSDHPAY
jgi:hypothetical protein